ncbi:MAG: hypothetical protein H6812_07935 [Phycisphaeraceae bacterium]|nr:hypothetical protein [Phycisphaerales bacterium]MCB9843175.1 hypothetical protein [Phycisphaeraceae bacterium]
MNPHLVAIQAIATLLMTGVIWFVQVVHYPLMRLVGEAEWVAYERNHQRRISFIVIPLMMIELTSATLLAFAPLTERLDQLNKAAFGLLIVVWLSTFLVQVPLHRRLERGYNERSIRLLVSTNWVRTIAWSCRAWLCLVVLEGVWGS